jgi:glycosyltransferase involved in cell wall biosynthesis
MHNYFESAMKKRVCIFMGRYAVGGVATFTREYIRILEKNSWDVSLVAGRPEPGEVSPTGLPDPIWIPGFRRSISPLHDILAFLFFVNLIRRMKPDALITQTAKAGVIGRLAGTICGVNPTIQIFQGHVLKDFYGPGISWIFCLIERIMARFCNVIVLPKQSDVEFFGKVLKIKDKEKLKVLPPAQNPGELENAGNFSVDQSGRRERFRKKYGLRSDDCAILMIGRLAKIKNFEFAVRIFSHLKKTSTESFKLLIVGAGPDEQKIRDLVFGLGLAESVFFTGVISDLRDVYSGSDMFLHTSRHEGHGIVVLDAMFAGLPVVSSAQGLVTELKHDKVWVLELTAETTDWVQALIAARLKGQLNMQELNNLYSNYKRLFRPQDLEQDLMNLVRRVKSDGRA